MKPWFFLLASFALSGCAYTPVYNGKEEYSGAGYLLDYTPRHTLDYFVQGMADQLVASNQYLTPRTPIAITSFVEVQNLEETDWLGNTVSEAFMYQMQQRGFTVIDFKATGSIQVTPDGDFALSRNWEELAQSQQVDYVLTGTMLRQSGGVMINARIVGIRSRVVVASAQGFLPQDRIGRDLDNLNRVRLEDGAIIRDDAVMTERYNVILKP
ncbi:hypothetical protein VST7929_02044 [Vibrio stylophorae]|uniref:FlgO domain-containing protein n=1 Tax=Vibrio stylophorae TaxID=659351 RepID=A0ABM8ZVA1_9VIBR|nr:FlgO family outer membrane protein [Vibrio stylophorae]CAH0534143.1 hypothetical protein VST7929_02044 [Vibrio stylophorae]